MPELNRNGRAVRMFSPVNAVARLPPDRLLATAAKEGGNSSLVLGLVTWDGYRVGVSVPRQTHTGSNALGIQPNSKPGNLLWVVLTSSCPELRRKFLAAAVPALNYPGIEQ